MWCVGRNLCTATLPHKCAVTKDITEEWKQTLHSYQQFQYCDLQIVDTFVFGWQYAPATASGCFSEQVLLEQNEGTVDGVEEKLKLLLD